jgi:hypothetical protein
MVYCPEEYEVWFMSYELLKLSNFDMVEFTDILGKSISHRKEKKGFL